MMIKVIFKQKKLTEYRTESAHSTTLAMNWLSSNWVKCWGIPVQKWDKYLRTSSLFATTMVSKMRWQWFLYINKNVDTFSLSISKGRLKSEALGKCLIWGLAPTSWGHTWTVLFMARVDCFWLLIPWALTLVWALFWIFSRLRILCFEGWVQFYCFV